MSSSDSQLIQIKVTPSVKKEIREIAEYKGVSVSALVKLTLKEFIRQSKKQIFTENGLTLEQELEVLEREREGIEAYRAGKLKSKTARQILKELHA